MTANSKTLSTLVSDFKDVLSNPKKYNWDGVSEEFSKGVQRLLEERLINRNRKSGLSLSQTCEPCHRKTWYKENNPDAAEQHKPEVLLKFLYGDIVELLALTLIKVSGHKVEAEQETVTLNGVPGHIDCIIDGVVVDIKSANSRGFDKFKYHELDHNDPFNYRGQLQAYVEAMENDPRVTEKNYGAFFAIDKELGHVVLDAYENKPVDLVKELESKKKSIAKKCPPERKFKDEEEGKSGNRKLCLQCSYCEFKNECWKDSNDGKGLRTFIYSNGPKFLTKVAKEPKDSILEVK